MADQEQDGAAAPKGRLGGDGGQQDDDEGRRREAEHAHYGHKRIREQWIK